MGFEFNAVKARLQSNVNLATKVFDSARRDEVTGGLIRDTYVVLFGGGPDVLDDGRLTGVQSYTSDATYDFPVQSVSTTAAGVRATAELVSSLLIGFTPTVSGRMCGAIRLDSSGVVDTDDSVKPPLFFIDDVYVLRSSRA